jgi:very-short-patch-repair endonuclease
MAALLAVGDDAVLSHRSAAVVWGLVRHEGRRVTVTAPRPLHNAPGLELHRTALAEDEIRLREGIRVTCVPRTLLDLAAVVGAEQLRRAVEQAEMLRMTDEVSLDGLFQRHPGRPGIQALRAILADGVATGLTRSELEERFLGFLEEHGLPRPRTNTTIETFEVDFAWPKTRLIAELDGHAFHAHRHAFERDRLRDRALQAAGWRVVRVTWRQLHGDANSLAADLNRLLGTV